MNAADFLIAADDHADIAVICPNCRGHIYTDPGEDVTIRAVLKLITRHIAAHAMSEHRDTYPSWTSSGSSTSATQTRTHTQTNS